MCETLVLQGGGAFGCIPDRFLDGTVSQEMSKNVVRQGGGGSEATWGRGICAVFGPRGIWRHLHTCTGFWGCLRRHVMASSLRQGQKAAAAELFSPSGIPWRVGRGFDRG